MIWEGMKLLERKNKATTVLGERIEKIPGDGKLKM